MEGNNVFYINNKEYIYNGQVFFYYETLEIFTYAYVLLWVRYTLKNVVGVSVCYIW